MSALRIAEAYWFFLIRWILVLIISKRCSQISLPVPSVSSSPRTQLKASAATTSSVPPAARASLKRRVRCAGRSSLSRVPPLSPGRWLARCLSSVPTRGVRPSPPDLSSSRISDCVSSAPSTVPSATNSKASRKSTLAICQKHTLICSSRSSKRSTEKSRRPNKKQRWNSRRRREIRFQWRQTRARERADSVPRGSITVEGESTSALAAMASVAQAMAATALPAWSSISNHALFPKDPSWIKKERSAECLRAPCTVDGR